MTSFKLFNLKARNLKRVRTKIDGMFLQVLARDEILERLEDINRSFDAIAIITGFPEIWSQSLPKANLVADSDTLNLAQKKYDLIIHAMVLHHSNDLVGQVIQSNQALKPDGLFIGSCFGGQTLAELRSALSTAEAEICGGLSPRISPMAEIRDLGAILQRAELALPVVDNLNISTSYRDLRHLMHDLRDMGETNIMTSRSKSFTVSGLFNRAQEIYAAEFRNSDGRLMCTFDLMFLSGWAPHKNQPRPLRPGSVRKSLLDALDEAKSHPND
ncbi:MAG: methyltransferase domain-containing protein [Planktomarina sp.]|nr:methyltransferase domain-containing protein [Planktomarina sp.]